MTTALSHTCGAASPTRTHLCNRGYCIGALLLGLQLAASAPPARADVDIDRLVFEAHVLTDDPLPQPPAAPASTGLTAKTSASTAGNGLLLTQVAALNQRIAVLEETEGAFSPGLVQEYLDLGLLYQNLSRHDAAIEAFEDAEYLNRITAGLVNPARLAIIEASLPSHLARGELQEMGLKQQTLYELTRELHGDGSNELVPMLARLGDSQVSSFRRSLQRRPVVSISFGGGGSSMDPRQAGFGNLVRAQLHYSEAITNLLQRQDLNSTALQSLEQKFLQTVYLTANRNGLLDDPDFFLNGRRSATGSRIQHREMQGYSPNFVNGRASIQRMRIYARLRQQPLVEQASLLLDEADWHLLFKHYSRARQLYDEALALLQSAALPAAELDALLRPAVPLQLPTFTALPHSRGHYGLTADVPLQWEGWIDVSFGLSRNGKPVQLQILGSSAGTDKAVQSRLRRLLLASPFRPRMESAVQDGDSDAAAHVYRLRYYYAQADAPVVRSREP